MVATALLSAQLTAGWVLLQDRTYEGSVTVFLSQLFPRGTTVADIDPFAETFQLTMTSPERTAQIAREAGVPVAEVRARLSSTRSGQSPIVTVSYGPGDEGSVTEVAQQAAVIALRELSRTEVDQAEARLAQVRAAADAARTELRAFETRTGLIDLDEAYEAQRAAVAVQLQAGATADVVAAAQAELDRLAGLRLERDELEGRLGSAQGGANAAEADRLAADARLAAAEAPSLILAGEATQVSRLPQLARGVIGSLLVALAFWAAVYALVDRRARRVAASPPAAASGDVEGGEEAELGDDVGDPEDDRFVHGDLDLYASEPVGSGVRAAGGTFADQPRA
jgi:DNA-binding transcriptional MerR regulator